MLDEADQMVARTDDIEHGEEDGGLPGGCQHGGCAALKRGDTRRDGVVRRVLQAGIEIAAGLQIEQPPISALLSYLNVVLWMMGIWRGSPFFGL